MNKNMFEEVAKTKLKIAYIDQPVDAIGFKHKGKTAFAMIVDHNKKDKIPMVRVHSQCLFGDVFASLKCDCHEQLHKSIELIKNHGYGIIIYLEQEGRGAGLINKIKAYQLQSEGLDTVEAFKKLHLPADLRDYIIAAEILHYLGITKINLLTNNPSKIDSLTKYHIKIETTTRVEIQPNEHNKKYLETKKKKMRHMLELV